MNLKLEEKVEQFFDKYGDYMKFFEDKSVIAKTRGVTNEDLYALGMQLENYQDFQTFSEANGGYGDLGVLPNIALDVITNPPILPSVAVIEPLIATLLFFGSKWNIEELISIFPVEPLIYWAVSPK